MSSNLNLGPCEYALSLDEDIYILDSEGNYIAEMVTEDSEGRMVSPEMQEVYANLFVTAPEMLAYLKASAEMMGEDVPQELLELIAKAEGRTNG